MDYLSFDLRLGEWNATAGTGVAEVLQSPAGEGARYPFRLDVDVNAIAGLTGMSADLAMRLGKRLAAGVFSQQSLTLWYESYQVARERRRGLRLRAHVDSWDLARLPWELLYDARRGDFLVFDPLVSIVRYVRLYSPPPALRHGERLKVLALSAAPRTEAQLDWQREFQVLRAAVEPLVEGAQVELVTCEHTTHERLHRLLSEHQPDVVHYVGHGGYDAATHTGLLLLESPDGEAAPLAAQDAARLLRRYGVNLVVLNACETAKGAWAGLGPSLVRREVPAVVAMQWPVEDGAAVHFAEHFYQALAQGRTIDECVAEGRMGAAASGGDAMAWAAPVLFLRSVSGRLWASPGSSDGDRHQATTGQAPAAPPGEAPGAGPNGDYFKTRGPLASATDAEIIVERPELRRVLRLVQQPSVTQYVAVLSARQMGKTTLLFRVMDLVRASFPCVFIDLSVLRKQRSAGCFRFVGGKLAQGLGDGSGQLPQAGDAVTFVNGLADLARASAAPRLVVMLDEVGALEPEASDALFNALRTVFTEGRGPQAELAKYLFIFSGAVDLYGLTYGSNSPLNICEKVYLHDFAAADVARLVGLLGNLGIQAPKEAAERIYALTGGHPYLTMRMCALLEHSRARRLTPETIEQAADQILVEDDNIHHLIRELERLPAERRRLRAILLEGQAIPFSRNDPVLAGLEMIGAVKPAQPCQVRNELYARALRPYLEGKVEQGEAPTPARQPAGEDAFQRLAALHAAALGPGGGYARGKAWQAFAGALFGLVPAFTVYANVRTDAGPVDALIGVDPDAEGGGYWRPYEPAILVEPVALGTYTPRRLIAEALGRAEAHGVRLVILVCAGAEGPSDEGQSPSGARGERCLISLNDAEIRALIASRGNLDALLRRKVLEARLRRL